MAKKLIESTGDGYPKNRSPELKQLASTEAFTSNDFFNNAEIPYDEGNYFFRKESTHPEDRMTERTPFNKKYVDLLQKLVDTMQLTTIDEFHLPLRDHTDALQGYAQFKKVPNRKYPVLVTVLNKNMKPRGANLEHMLKPGQNKLSGLFTTDQLSPRPPESKAWILNHTRIDQPRSQEQEIQFSFDRMNVPWVI